MNLNKAEQELYYCMNGRGGSFTTSLFQTIMKADIDNQAKLKLSFPDEVDVVVRYQCEPGYWEKIQEEMIK